MVGGCPTLDGAIRARKFNHAPASQSLVMIFDRDASPQTALVQHSANLGHLPGRRIQCERSVEIVVCFVEFSAQVIRVGSIAVGMPIFALDLERLGAIVDGDGGLALGGMRCAKIGEGIGAIARQRGPLRGRCPAPTACPRRRAR